MITWNVATQFPGPGDDLGRLLGDARPDLLLLGLQEVKSQPQNLASDLWTGEDVWTSGLRASLASSGYIKVRSIRLVGTVLSLFSLARHLPHIRGQNSFQFQRINLVSIFHFRFRDSVHEAGHGRLLGQQGLRECPVVSVRGLGVRPQLPPGRPHPHEQGSQCHHLSTKSLDSLQDRIESYNKLLGSHLYSNKDTEMILYHDYVIWMGDLNFRLEIDPKDLSNEEIISRIAR